MLETIFRLKKSNLVLFINQNDNLITYSYPKYNNEWRVHATVDGNLYDYETGRNYYALFWEGIDNNIYDMNEGFIVAGKGTVKFLEDKLSILGLNDKEINEFIVYWLPKMEDNKYQYDEIKEKEERKEKGIVNLFDLLEEEGN